MNKEKIKMLMSGLILLVVLICGIKTMSYHETHYTIECNVIGIKDNIVTVIDLKGDIWEFKSNGNDFKTGQKIKIKMYTNKTPNTNKDDKIVGIVTK